MNAVTTEKSYRERSLLIIQQYAISPDQPGGTRHFEMAKNLSDVGWRVRILASDFSHPERRFTRRIPSDRRRIINRQEDGVAFSYAWVPPYEGNNRGRILSMLWFALAAVWSVLRGSESCVMGSSPHIFAAAGAYLGARIRRRNFIFEVRDLWPESYEAVQPGAKTSLQYRLIGLIANHLYRHADLVVILAEGNRDIVLSRGASPEKLICIPNGVDLSSFASFDRKSQEGLLRFVYTGAHGEANGLDVVLDAAKALMERGVVDFSVSLIGDGPQKERLKDRVANEGLSMIDFSQPMPKTEMPVLLSNFDVGLMILAPADLFTFGVSPNKLFDYFSANLPIVSNVQGSVAEAVKAANGGVTSNGTDAEALADAMAQMIDLGRDQLGAQFGGGRAFVEANFNRSDLAAQLEVALSRLTH